MSNTLNTIAVVVSYVSPTNTRGSRVKVEIPRMRIKKILSLDHQYNSPADQIEAWLFDIGVSPIAQAELPKAHAFVVNFIHWDALANCFGKA